MEGWVHGGALLLPTAMTLHHPCLARWSRNCSLSSYLACLPLSSLSLPSRFERLLVAWCGPS